MKNAKPKKILVVAPHADDEVLGAGASIVKHKRLGNSVFVCIFTEAYTPDWSAAYIKNKRREIERAHKILGIKKTFLLGYPTVKLDTIPRKELNDALQKVVNEIRPDIVYVPHGGDLNHDHQIVFEAALVATRPQSGSTVRTVYSYETVSETEWGRNIAAFVPSYFEELQAGDLKAKLEAMRAYRSENRPYPHPRSPEALTILAKMRGTEVSKKACEAFSLIRQIS